ncbi:hypothetical protein ACLB2K_074867 [Fragaria x ananassa]
MAASSSCIIAILTFVHLLFMGTSTAQLSSKFYSKSCPRLFSTVKSTVQAAIRNEPRMGASLLRLHFHDCFVNGCDGSVLLDDTANFTGEKNAVPNKNSVRGFNVIDNIKSAVENVCPGVVSCADILAITARDSVAILGGPSWNVKLGRRDARTASQAAANSSIPPPTSNLNQLISRFNALGLSTKDMVALSGSHTIGQARCTTFRARVYNETNNLESSLAQTRKSNCPRTTGSGDNNLAPLDLQSPTAFDNNYYKNLIKNRGLLHSDQQLFLNGGSTDSIVRGYSSSQSTFTSDFAAAMIKMGNINPLTEMASSCPLMAIFMTLALVASNDSAAGAGLTSEFYARSCPKLFSTVRSIVQSAIDKNPRMGACLLRLFFHDCFINGCDASLLLDDVLPFFIGEKNVHPNKGSACGFEIIDQIKNAVERACPGLLGGPKWEVQLGRKDAKTTNPLVANISIPTSSASLKELIIRFGGVALSTRDLVALSGAHTLGQAQCHNFRKRIYNDSNIDKDFAEQRRVKCPRTSGNTNLAPIDGETPYVFDNSYYKNLVKNKGLLHSDQQLFSGGRTDALVKTYSVSQESFFMDFVSAMLKMGSINPLIGPAASCCILI